MKLRKLCDLSNSNQYKNAGSQLTGTNFTANTID